MVKVTGSGIKTHTTVDAINCDQNKASETKAAVAASINDNGFFAIRSGGDIQEKTEPEAAGVCLDADHCTSKHTCDTSTRAKQTL